MSISLAHLSDLHLSQQQASRTRVLAPVAEAIRQSNVDGIAVTGDLTDDGWDSDLELDYGAGWLTNLGPAVKLVVPGNHDVGNFIGSDRGSVRPERALAWARLQLRDKLNLPGWRILGLNSMILGTQWPSEAEQRDRVQRELNEAREAHDFVAIMLHSPLFVVAPDEPDDPRAEYWIGPKPARAALWSVIEPFIGNTVKLIGSGHVHQSRLTDINGVRIAWAPPASGTWVISDCLPNDPPPTQTGFFIHELHDDGKVISRLVECAPIRKSIHWPPPASHASDESTT